jgi:CheY-like chemotaxis protein
VKRYVATDLVDVLVAPLWTAAVVLLTLGVLYLFRKQLGRLFRDLGIKRMSILGVDLEWVEEQTEAAYRDKKMEVPPQSQLRSVAALTQQLAPLLQHRRVLWVDDDPWHNTGETRLLRGLGVDVENERTTEAAVDRMRKEPAGFDLVISDWSRGEPGPNDEGPRLLQQLRDDVRWHGPFLFYAGEASDERKAKAAELGAVAVTIEPDELLKHALVELSDRRWEQKRPINPRAPAPRHPQAASAGPAARQESR